MPERSVYVVGIGMTNFVKPGSRVDYDYPEMVKEAVDLALADADLKINSIQAAYVGYVYGDSACGQRALYEMGLFGIPMFNVHNNCATGSSVLYLAKTHIENGLDCVLALGFEKMERGPLNSKYLDRTNPLDKLILNMSEKHGIEPKAPIVVQLFGNAAREHMQLYGTKQVHFAKIAEKNHRHSANNPKSQFKDVFTLQQIMESPMIFDPLTKLQCCPTSDGAAAVLLCSESFVEKCNLKDKAVKIVGMEIATDLETTFQNSAISRVGFDMTKLAADRLYAKTGVNPCDIGVVELHDCFSSNELISYEALGLCSIGEAGKFIDDNQNTYGGQVVVNPSGGLISKGHPLGATGIAQCIELCLQLRQSAGKRQVLNLKYALQHNLALGGAVVVALYQKGFLEQKISVNPKNFKVHRLFTSLEEALKSNLMNLFFKFEHVVTVKVMNCNQEVGQWVVNTKKGKGMIEFNGTDKPDLTIEVEDKDLHDIVINKISLQKAIIDGTVKVDGNVSVALKLIMLENFVSMSNKVDNQSKL